MNALAQDWFKFEIRVEPNKTYTTEMQTSTNGLIDFIADEAILEQMKGNGLESPMKMEQESTITMVSKTEARDVNGNIPAMMGYEKMTSKTIVNGKPIETPNVLEGMKIIGTYNSNNKFEIDSIVGNDITDLLRNTLSSTIENVQKQIDFPKNEIKIGESFVNEIPMSIPMQGMNPMSILVKTNYLLQDMKNGIAYFDLEQVITLDSQQEEMKMNASGTGKGKCEFNIEGNYLSKYNSELPMTLSLEMNEMMSMKMQMDTKTSMTIQVDFQ